MSKGLTDLFAICLNVHIDLDDSAYQYITNRVVDPILYIKYLTYIMCDLTANDMNGCLKDNIAIIVHDDHDCDIDEVAPKREGVKSIGRKVRPKREAPHSENLPGVNRRSDCWNHSDLLDRMNAKLDKL